MYVNGVVIIYMNMMNIKYSDRYLVVNSKIDSEVKVSKGSYRLSMYESIITKNLIVSYYKVKESGYMDYRDCLIFLEYDKSYTTENILLDVEINLNRVRV